MNPTSDTPPPPIPSRASRAPSRGIYFHLKETCVVLESAQTSSLVICVDENAAINFQTFTGPPEESSISVRREMQISIHGTLGMFEALSGWFIVLITENHIIGSILEHQIFRATNYQIMPIPSQKNITEDEKRVQEQFLRNLSTMLLSCGFYYSPTYDITHSVQRQSQVNRSLPQWKRIDQRFFWNAHFMKEFISRGLDDWILPVMDGFVEMSVCHARLGQYLFILISRRECYRTGARYLTRGADPEGHVANFAETEQIIVCNGNISSWVQTRGSIPLIWYQPTSVNTLKPKPTVDHSPFTKTAFRNHIETQISIYGPHLLVNLIDQKGNEQDVGETFETQMRLFDRPSARYLAFDFHEECKNNNYARLQVLVDKSKGAMESGKYFLQDHNGNVLVQQNGNIRTNCIDCLDRTNVVQSQFGRWMLRTQLANLGIISATEEYSLGLINVLNNIWTNNADTLSKRYTGVGALKTDFTRTGKRSAKGAMADGVKSVSRLYHSTFNDTSKQGATEFFLGKFSFLPISYIRIKRTDVTRYKVEKKRSGKVLILELHTKEAILRVYDPESFICKTLLLSDVVRISRVYKNYFGVSLLFTSSSLAKVFLFASTLEREKFLIRVSRVTKLDSAVMPVAPTIQLLDLGLPSVPNTAPIQKPSETFRFFIGSVNHSAMLFNDPPPLEGSIPTDRDIYIIGAQNCYYRSPPGFYFSAAAHWTFLIQKHLGDAFEVVSLSKVQDRLVTIILARKDFLHRISNVRQSFTVLAPVRQPTATSMRTNSKGFGGFLRTITSEVKKGFTPPDSSSSYGEADYLGLAVSLCINSTSICFINTNRFDLPFRVLDFDVANDFHHVFLFGDVNSARIDEQYYIPLYLDANLGSVYWRNLLNTKLDAIISAKGSSRSTSIPVSVCFTMRTSKYLHANAKKQAKIVLLELSAQNLQSIDRAGRIFDPYLIIHAPCVTKKIGTNPKIKSNNPQWDDVLTVSTIPLEKDYLADQHLIVEVMDQEEGYLIGKGVISLRNGVEHEDVVQEIVIRLSALDETRGAVRGKFYVSFSEQDTAGPPIFQQIPPPTPMTMVDSPLLY